MDAQPLMEAIRAIDEAYRSLEETKKGANADSNARSRKLRS
jgi:hypothetical protein